MKRQLSNKYSELVAYVNKVKPFTTLGGILQRAVKTGNDPYGDAKMWAILDDIYITSLTDAEMADLVYTITDIYNDNYELTEPKYYWRFDELTGNSKHDLYLSLRFGFDGTKLSDKNCGLLDPEQYSIVKFTKSDVSKYLVDNTDLSIDNFTPAEEINS